MKKKITISFLLAFVMVLAVAFPVSGALDTSSDTYYVADDPSNYSMVECPLEESDIVVYDFDTKTETYYKFTDNEINVARSSDVQKYWPGHLPEGMTFDVESYSTRDIIGGTDTRVHITNTSASPYSRIAFLSMEVTKKDGTTGKTKGTGWMVHRNIVVTAAHALYCYSSETIKEGYVESVKVIPGASESNSTGTSYVTSFPVVMGAQMIVPSQYKISGNTNYDYGVIILNSNVGTYTGWFSMLNGTNHSLDVANVTGYSADRSGDTSNRYMYRGVGAVTQTGNKLYYQIDTEEGQSGAPIYDSNNNVVGIHTHGTNNTSTGNNSGVSLNASAYTFIMNAINAYGT